MDSESLDRCIQTALASLYPPFQLTSPTVLCQVLSVVERCYRGDGLRYLIHFLLPAKNFLQNLQQDACVQHCGLLFRHEGWPLCVHEKIVVQLCPLDQRLLRPGDFYLLVSPAAAPPPRSKGASCRSGASVAPRLLLCSSSANGHHAEQQEVSQLALRSLFSMAWLDSVNRERERRGAPRLEHCLLAAHGDVFRVPWEDLVYPQFISRPRPAARGHEEHTAKDAGVLINTSHNLHGDTNSSGQDRKLLQHGTQTGQSAASSEDEDSEGEYVELTELPRFSPQKGSLTQSISLQHRARTACGVQLQAYGEEPEPEPGLLQRGPPHTRRLSAGANRRRDEDEGEEMEEEVEVEDEGAEEVELEKEVQVIIMQQSPERKEEVMKEESGGGGGGAHTERDCCSDKNTQQQHTEDAGKTQLEKPPSEESETPPCSTAALEEPDQSDSGLEELEEKKKEELEEKEVGAGGAAELHNEARSLPAQAESSGSAGSSPAEPEPSSSQSSQSRFYSVLLRSGAVCLPGSTDRAGRALLTVSCCCSVWSEPDYDSAELLRLLLYYISTLRKETRASGLTVLMDGRRAAPTATAAAVFSALRSLQEDSPGSIHTVFILANKDSALRLDRPAATQVEVLNSLKSLQKHVELHQLPAEFGGSFSFSQSSWISFRSRVEQLSHQCEDVISLLQKTIHVLQATPLPAAQDAELLLSRYKAVMRSILEDSRLVQLQQEGGASLSRLRRDEGGVGATEEQRAAVEEVTSLYDQVDELLHRLVTLSNARTQELSFISDFRSLEQGFSQVRSWLQDVGEVRLKTLDEAEDSLELLTRKQQDFKEFYTTAYAQCKRGEELLSRLDRWAEVPSADLQVYEDRVHSFWAQLQDFSQRVNSAGQNLERAVQLYRFLDQCLTCVSPVSHLPPLQRKQLELGDKMDLSSYLLKPIQRMSKYALLLSDLMKEVGVAQEAELIALQAATNMVKFQLRHGNDLLAMDAIRDCDVNLKEQGQLIRQDEFTVCSGRRKCQRHIFLFEELVLFSKPKKMDGGLDVFIYKHSFKTADVGLTESTGDSGLRFEIWFRRRTSKNQTFTLQASSADVKHAWTSDIARILWTQATRNKEMRLKEMVSMGVGNKPFLDIQPSDAAISDRAVHYIMKSRGARTRASIAVSVFDHSNPFKRGAVTSDSAASGPSSSSLLGPLNLHMYSQTLPSPPAAQNTFSALCIEEDEQEHETSSQPSMTTESSGSSSRCLSGSTGSDSGCVSSHLQEGLQEEPRPHCQNSASHSSSSSKQRISSQYTSPKAAAVISPATVV
ncbi:puratrophin-1 [Stegastes partitus]|uniref:Puratrophin-1 n=1 Tax=Stegastes partitus TaxID=144197 RepID=A0A9Y4N1J5_9TELE|nr:PREDICTED: puratrophin-1-like [Stegastes partitus]